MVEPSPVSPPQTPNEFPQGNTVKGKVYQLANPASPLQQICVMGMDTYMETGTLIASQQQMLAQMLAKQDARIKELLADEQVWSARVAEVTNKLENLRAVRRSEMRPEVEDGLLGLPASYLPKR
jgi:hypothetical protein